MTAYLPPVEKPRGVLINIVYLVSRRMFGKVPTGTKVFTARMPSGFISFYNKTYALDKRLKLAPATSMLVRQHVASINGCAFCMDAGRWFAMRESPENAARMDALADYQSDPLITAAERAALDYAGELTRSKKVAPDTFAKLLQHFSERDICDIVWLVASEHLANLTNLGLNIGSEGLCDMPAAPASRKAKKAAAPGQR